MLRIFAFCLAVLALCVACVHTPEPATDRGASPLPWYVDAQMPGEPVLGPGDKLYITVLGAPELSQAVTLGADGRFEFDYVGLIKGAGRNVSDVAAALRTALASELRNPDVEVQLLERADLAVYIGGLVNPSGRRDVAAGSDLLQALVLAGAELDTGRDLQVVLIRRSEDGTLQSAQFPVGDLTRPPAPPLILMRRFDVVIVRREQVENLDTFAETVVRSAVPADIAAHFADKG